MSVATTIALGVAAPASAQIEQGDVVYIEGADGGLELYRRLDRPNEPDGRAQFVRLPAGEAEAFIGAGGSAEVVPVIDRAAVVSPTATSTMDVAVQAPPAQAEVATTGAAPPLEVEQPSALERALVRLRVGGTLHGGYTLGDDAEDPEGWMAGLSLRVGVQISDWFAVYYQPSGILAGLETTPSGGDYDEAFTLWNALLAEATLFDFLSIGAGPSLDFYWGCDAGIQSQAACADENPLFGLHGRVAVNIGGLFLDQRGAFNVSFDFHPTWFEDDVKTYSMLGGIGVELY
ncbi:hypothetical protein DB32_000995 [Sandaracinus amylolyticus]|uniref:Outer membrane protein beta-barrel domain-containing protein n=1 Tax=Sandaracinus amylolyticus TaxID=927083 RepID=A0A0F6W040_9BACT|nr:hypothetical protein DB32_000995 [Sandaracinus amylolyticus]